MKKKSLMVAITLCLTFISCGELDKRLAGKLEQQERTILQIVHWLLICKRMKGSQ